MKAIALLLLFVSPCYADLLSATPQPNWHEFQIVNYAGPIKVTNFFHDASNPVIAQAPTSVWGLGPGNIIIESERFTWIAPFQSDLQRMESIFRFFNSQGHIDLNAYWPRVYRIDLRTNQISLPLENRGPVPLTITSTTIPEPKTIVLSMLLSFLCPACKIWASNKNMR